MVTQFPQNPPQPDQRVRVIGFELNRLSRLERGFRQVSFLLKSKALQIISSRIFIPIFQCRCKVSEGLVGFMVLQVAGG